MDFEASHILHIKFQEQFRKGKIKRYFLQINLRGNQVQKAGKRKYKAYIQRGCQGDYLKEKDVPQKERFHPGL